MAYESLATPKQLRWVNEKGGTVECTNKDGYITFDAASAFLDKVFGDSPKKK